MHDIFTVHKRANVAMMFKITCLHLLMFISILNHGCTCRSGLSLTNDCACPGNNLIFECTVVGIAGGSTQWKGDTIHSCSEPVPVFLRHRHFIAGTTQPIVCNGGEIIIRSLRVDSDCYTSQMNISFSNALINRTVICAYDDGTRAVEVGSMSIGATKKSYPPPTGIHLSSANPNQLTFAWNLVSQECSAFHYDITAQNCGDCPSRTHHDTAACSDYSVSTQAVTCSFVLQTVFCVDGSIGNRSNSVEVTLKVPEPPFVDIIVYRYSHLTGNIIGFVVQFNAVSSFAISDEIEGSVLSYTLSYNNSLSGVSCGSAIVPASSCVDGLCQHSFTYEGSACHSAFGVNVSISAANVLGSSPLSYPNTVQDQSNMFISVVFELETNSIVCNFEFQTHSSNKKFCSIDYGPEGESCSSYSQTSHGTSDMVRIGLPLQLSPTVRYCFTVTGSNSAHTAIVEGTFTPGHVNITQASCAVPLGLSLTFVILISSGIIITLIIIIVLLARAYKKVQVQLVKVQTVKAVCTTPTTAIRKPNTSRIYEELDGDIARADEVLDVENLAYPPKDFHRSRCATPCSDSGEAEGAYYCTI